MQKITAIIPTFNEESNIEAAIKTVKWADEILIVDSFSTDNTLSIVKQYTNRILQREYIHSASQKNWTIPQASYGWVFLLDADERVTPELQEEIQQLLKSDNLNDYDAYWINRQNHFMGQKINYSGWQGDAVIRLFRREVGKYEDKNVHAEIIQKGIKVGHLKHKLDHYTFRDSTHFLQKMHRYAKWSARDYLAKTPKVGLYHLLVKPLFRIFKHFILQKGFLDGKVGFIISSMMAWGVFLRYVKILEHQKGIKPLEE